MATTEWIIEAAIRKYKNSYRAQVQQHQRDYSDAEKIAFERSLSWALDRLKYADKPKLANKDKWSLRDLFAAKAMQSIFGGVGAQQVADRDARYDETNWVQVVAANAYEMADAMLKQREKDSE